MPAKRDERNAQTNGGRIVRWVAIVVLVILGLAFGRLVASWDWRLVLLAVVLVVAVRLIGLDRALMAAIAKALRK